LFFLIFGEGFEKSPICPAQFRIAAGFFARNRIAKVFKIFARGGVRINFGSAITRRKSEAATAPLLRLFDRRIVPGKTDDCRRSSMQCHPQTESKNPSALCP